MDNSTENQDIELKGNKGKIVALIFIAIILLPAGYAVLKEYRLSKQAKQNTTPAATVKQPD